MARTSARVPQGDVPTISSAGGEILISLNKDRQGSVRDYEVLLRKRLAERFPSTTFFFEPARPIAATIVLFFNGINNPAFHATLFALASVLLVSALFLSLGGWAVKRPLRKYGVR